MVVFLAVIFVIATIWFVFNYYERSRSGPGRAVSVARIEAKKRGWGFVIATKPKLVWGYWELMVTKFPGAPGEHAFVAVSSDGKVLSFSPGL